jgi:hypothetical protein
MDLGQIARLKDVQESALLETLQKIRQLWVKLIVLILSMLHPFTGVQCSVNRGK